MVTDPTIVSEMEQLLRESRVELQILRERVWGGLELFTMADKLCGEIDDLMARIGDTRDPSPQEGEPRP